MATTIKDIALKLGVSHSTVSRALRGFPYVNPELRRRVQEAALEMNYHPNALARGLKGMRTRVIGLIIPDLMIDFYACAATIIQATLAKEGYRLLLSVSGNDPASELAYLRAMREERVQGLIWVPWAGHEQVLAEYAEEEVPIVQFGRKVSRQLDAILPDDGGGSRTATEHLLALGHNRIGLLVGSRRLSSGHARLQGYLQALSGAGLAPDDRLVKIGSFDRKWGLQAAEDLLGLPDPPTAIFAASSELLIGALRALDAHQLRIPHEMSVVGFGNPDWYGIWSPPITTVTFSTSEMAAAAVEVLLHRIRDHSSCKAPRPGHSRFPCRLVKRESTARPRASIPSPDGQPAPVAQGSSICLGY